MRHVSIRESTIPYYRSLSMSDPAPIAMSNPQWQSILQAVNALGDHTPYWEHLLTQAAPVFLGSLLGIGSALLLDALRTGRENKKALVDRQEKDAAELLEREQRELAQLNLVSTAMAFNLENIQHIAMQQVLPHFYDSNKALSEIQSFTSTEQIMKFGATMSAKFRGMMTKVPETYFFELDFFKEIPFVLENDPEILKFSGWMKSFTNELKNNFTERNTWIEAAGNPRGLPVPELLESVRVQAEIAKAEVVHTFQLFQQIIAICAKVRKVVEKYEHVKKAHLKVEAPEPVADTLVELERIVRSIVPNYPPPEPGKA